MMNINDVLEEFNLEITKKTDKLLRLKGDVNEEIMEKVIERLQDRYSISKTMLDENSSQIFLYIEEIHDDLMEITGDKEDLELLKEVIEPDPSIDDENEPLI